MRFVARYLGNYKRDTILAPLFKMLEAIFELLVPFVVASIIDTGVGGDNMGYVGKMALLMVGLAFIGAFSALWAQYFAARTATSVAYDVRRDLNEAILNMSPARYREVGKATLLTRMTSDVNQLQSAVNMFLRLFLRSPFIVIGAFVMSLVIDVEMSMIIGGIILVLAIVVYFVMRTTLPRISGIQSKLDGLNLRIRNNYGGAKLVRGFVIQKQEEDKFQEQLDDIYKSQLQVGRISNILNPVTFALINLGIILILYFGGGKVEIGGLTTGEVVALLNYMSQILVELVKLANLIVLLMKGIPSANRIADVVDYEEQGEEEVPTIVNSCRRIVEEELSNISQGENIGIIGPTGSGKSLLLSQYMLLSKNKDGIGYVPQEDNFFTGSIGNNILLREYTQEDISYALDMSCFREVVEVKGGVDTIVNKNASNLSGGQKKRLALARALQKRPELLLMDDTTNPLDMITEKKIITNVISDTKMSVIIASQKPSAVMRADKIYVIDGGKLLDVGKHSELLNRCELYSKMYRAQFPEEEVAL